MHTSKLYRFRQRKTALMLYRNCYTYIHMTCNGCQYFIQVCHGKSLHLHGHLFFLRKFHVIFPGFGLLRYSFRTSSYGVTCAMNLAVLDQIIFPSMNSFDVLFSFILGCFDLFFLNLILSMTVFLRFFFLFF